VNLTRIFSGVCAVILLNLGIVNIALSEISGIEETGWADDAFIAYFYESGYSQATVDSIFSVYSCTQYTELSPRSLLVLLPDGSDEESIVANFNVSSFDGVRGVDLNWQYSILETSVVQKTNYIDPPPEIQPDPDKLPDDYLVDPSFNKQWNLNEACLNVPSIWGLTTGYDEDLVVFILDSGLYSEHEEFAAGIQSGRIGFQDFTYTDDGGSKIPVDGWPLEIPNKDYMGHGTKVAGVIAAAHNGFGIMGVAPDVKLIIGKITYCRGSSALCNIFSDAIWINAFNKIGDFALANPTTRIIVNVSWGVELTSLHSDFGEFEYAMEKCTVYNNVLFVAASGNGNSCYVAPDGKINPPGYSSYPALFSSESHGYYNAQLDKIVVAVGGTTYSKNERADASGEYFYIPRAYDYTSYAAYGDTCQLVVDVSAPAGGNIVQGECSGTSPLGIYVPTLPDGSEINSYDYTIGTSYSAPAVAGLAALTWALYPEYLAEELKTALRSFTNQVAYIPRNYVSSDFDAGYVLYGSSWGLHKYKGFYDNYETVICPLGGIIPDRPPLVSPAGEAQSSKSSARGFDDYACSPAMGSGIPNAEMLAAFNVSGVAYLITGGVMTDDVVISESSVVRFMGDLVIPAGKTMRVEAPTAGSGTIRFGFMENIGVDLGNDPSRIEIIVESGGRLEIMGNIIMAPYKLLVTEDESPWGGVTVKDGGYFGNPEQGNTSVSLYGARDGLNIESSTTDLSDIYIDTASTGLRVSAPLSINSVTITGQPLLGCLIDTLGVLNVTGEVNVETSLLTSYGGTGIHMERSAVLTAPVVNVQRFSYGMVFSWPFGVILDSQVTISDCLIHGILINDGGGILLKPGLEINGCLQDGIRVENTQNVVVEGAQLVSCAGFGLNARGISTVRVRDTEFLSNDGGVFVGLDVILDAGTSSDPGNNTFSGSSWLDLGNFNSNVTTAADGNLWSGRHGLLICPPNALYLLGSVSTACQ